MPPGLLATRSCRVTRTRSISPKALRSPRRWHARGGIGLFETGCQIPLPFRCQPHFLARNFRCPKTLPNPAKILITRCFLRREGILQVPKCGFSAAVSGKKNRPGRTLRPSACQMQAGSKSRRCASLSEITRGSAGQAIAKRGSFQRTPRSRSGDGDRSSTSSTMVTEPHGHRFVLITQAAGGWRRPIFAMFNRIPTVSSGRSRTALGRGVVTTRRRCKNGDGDRPTRVLPPGVPTLTRRLACAL